MRVYESIAANIATLCVAADAAKPWRFCAAASPANIKRMTAYKSQADCQT